MVEASPEPPSSLDEACLQLDQLLTQSVGEQLASDVPVGVWLSGGLDSSTVLHYAARAYPGRLRTFSITFQGRSFDESRHTREISRRYGTEHAEFDLSPSPDLADAIEHISYYSDEPSGDAGALPVWFLSRMSKKSVTVLLSGEGADELFAGYLTTVPTAMEPSPVRCQLSCARPPSPARDSCPLRTRKSVSNIR